MSNRSFIVFLIKTYFSNAKEPHQVTLYNMIVNRLNDISDKLEEQEKENTKYKQLEKELGCKLEVVFKALMNGIYTKESELDKELELYEVRGIEKKGVSVISKYCGYADCDFTCEYDNYKKTWWLKEDGSE